MKLANITRDVTTGAPVLTGSTVIKDPGGTTIATPAVDGVTGVWTYQQNGEPGITLATYTGADQVRDISGQVSIQSGNTFTGEIDRLMQAVASGVYGTNPLALSAPGGMFVRVGVGNMLIDGVLLPVYTAQDLAVAAAHATLNRRDIIVGRLTKTGTFAGRTLLAVVTGTPAASPVAPVPANDVNTHEVKLGEILLTAAASAVTGGMLSTTGREEAHHHVATISVFTRTATTPGSVGFTSNSVVCNAGEVCTGGGVNVSAFLSPSQGPTIISSIPSGNGWFCSVDQSVVSAFNLVCYAQCMSIALPAV
jgi:hypothetical protein